ncbi:MAG: ABC transporter substrate-binding protein [Chloroflexota bacterium]
MDAQLGFSPRRRFLLRGLMFASATGLLAACSPSAAPARPAEAPKPPAAPTEPPKPAATQPVQTAPATAKPAAATAPAKNEIVIAHAGQNAQEVSMDPNFESTEATVHLNMFDTLVRPTRSDTDPPKFGFEPGLAESWKSVDPTTWEVKLRAAKFHDGSDVSGEDVKYTFDFVTNKDNPPDVRSRMAANGVFEGLTEVQVVDPRTVRIKTSQPLPTFEPKLSRLYIVPKAYHQKVGPLEFGLKPVGTGPFKFASWSKGEQVVLEAFDGYWGGAPAIKKATFKQVIESAQRANMLKAGQADLVNDIPPNMFEGLKTEGKYETIVLKSMQHVLMGIDARQGPLADVRVRQAINYAVNRDEMIERLFKGFARRAVTTVADGLPGFTAQVNSMYPFDLEKARRLMAEAGHPNGFETGLLFSEGRLFLGREWTQAVVGYLEKLNIRATIETADGAQRLQRIREGKVPGLFLTSLLNQDIDAESPFRLWLSKKGRGFYWPQLEVDGEIEAQRSELNADKRRTVLEEINRKAVEHACFLFSHFENAGWAATKGLQVGLRHDGYILLHKARFA